MYLKVLSPKEELPVLGSDVDEASLVSVLNLADDGGSPAAPIPIQIRVDNGEPDPADHPTIAIAVGERVVIEKEYTDVLFAETLAGGGIKSGVYASKIAYSG